MIVKNNLVRRISGYPIHETAIWKQIAVVIRGPYEDHIIISGFANQKIAAVSLVVDLLIDTEIYKGIPISQCQRVK